MNIDGQQVIIYDIEVFPNFFLAVFKIGKKFKIFRETDFASLIRFINNKSMILAGFNNFGYDDVVLKWIIQNPNTDALGVYNFSKSIIEEGRNNQRIFKIQYSNSPWAFSIDILQMVNKRGSLKEWECRMQFPRVVESPCDFNEPLPKDRIPEIIDYCKTDVLATEQLLKSKWHLVDIRTKLAEIYDLGPRVYVLGDAGIAQHVYMTMHCERTGTWIGAIRESANINPDNRARKFKLKDIIFPFIKFKTKPFQEILERLKETTLSGDARGVTWQIDDPLFKKPIQLGKCEYQLGVGGIHSVDGPGVFEETSDMHVIDLDVTSYYPAIIINNKLYPKHLGLSFVEDIRSLRDKRVKAKKDGDKYVNEALKVVINASFGKLNDVYSPMRSVPDAHRVTINGQLMILMLIEILELNGNTILSANTDGVTIWSSVHCIPLSRSIEEWQKLTGHELEITNYLKYARRDVNNYVAMKIDGSIKRKGAFNPEIETGKWDGRIVRKAAEDYLLKNVDPSKTIKACTNIGDFLYYQRVKNGGDIYIDDTHIGKIARWYVAENSSSTIRRVNPDGSQACIPHGKNAELAMDIRDWDILGTPLPIDLKYYEEETWKLIESTNSQSGSKTRRKTSKMKGNLNW